MGHHRKKIAELEKRSATLFELLQECAVEIDRLTKRVEQLEKQRAVNAEDLAEMQEYNGILKRRKCQPERANQ